MNLKQKNDIDTHLWALYFKIQACGTFEAIDETRMNGLNISHCNSIGKSFQCSGSKESLTHIHC